jgi:predicted secreted protein
MPETPLPDRIDLRVKEEISFVLPGVGVSGYVWQLQVDGDSGAVEATVRREQAPSSPQMVGRATSEILAIRAIAPGNSTLNLALRRPWEHDATPLQSHTLIVSVT